MITGKDVIIGGTPNVRPPRTRVHFERFEYETDTDKDILERKLMQRAESRDILSAQELHMHGIVSRRGDRHHNIRHHLNCWGNYHHSNAYDSRIYDLFTAAYLHERSFWTTKYSHRYEWDHQSIGGNAIEVVLSTFKPEGAREIAALLIRPRWQGPTEQLVVLQGEDGWHAPGPVDQDKADSLVYAMSRIALAEVVRGRR